MAITTKDRVEQAWTETGRILADLGVGDLEGNREIRLSYHVENGILDRIRQTETPTLPGDDRNSWAADREHGHPLVEHRHALRLKLFDALTPGFYGVVTLSLEMRGKSCIMVRCSSERIHKIPALRTT